MSLKPIHLALYECSLLSKASLSVLNFYDVMLSVHSDEPDVVSLFTDLKDDWADETPPPESSFKMVRPFTKRESLDEDFIFATEFAKLGAMTTMIDMYWGLMGIGFLLHMKLQKGSPTEHDVQLGKYLLNVFSPGEPLEKILLSWSMDETWQHITERGMVDFPEAWWGDFPTAEARPLPSEVELKQALTTSGTFERLGEIEQQWGQYVGAYESLS